MYKTLIVLSCILALSLAQPTKPDEDPKKDKRSIGSYHYGTEAEVGYQNVPVVHNVNVPVTRHVSVPVTSSVSVPVIKNVAVPVVSYSPKAYYHVPTYYSYGHSNYGHSSYGHSSYGHSSYGHPSYGYSGYGYGSGSSWDLDGYY